MAFSGTISTTVFTTRNVVDHALRRCKIPTPKVTPEMQQIATDNLYLMLSALGNKGTLLWCQEKIIMGLVEGQIQYPTPIGTIDVQDVNIRITHRIEGLASSTSGTAQYAFDDDYTTACTELAPNGSITLTFADGLTDVTTFGILPNGNITLAFEVQYSTDGLTWTTVDTQPSTTYTDQRWAWFDLDPKVQATDMRIVATGGTTLDLREFYVGNNPSEIPLARINRDDYFNLPNKMFSSRPLQYWCDRQVSTPVLWLWPACNLGSRNQQIVLVRKRHIMDVGTLQENIEVPQRWMEAIIWCLAWRCALEIPEVDPAILPLIQPSAEKAQYEVSNEENDRSTVRWMPDISPYTR